MDHRGPAPDGPAPDSDAAGKVTGNNRTGNIPIGSWWRREEGISGKAFGNTVEISTVYPGLDISHKPQFQRRCCRVATQRLSPGGEGSPPPAPLAAPHLRETLRSTAPQGVPAAPTAFPCLLPGPEQPSGRGEMATAAGAGKPLRGDIRYSLAALFWRGTRANPCVP